MMYIYVMVIKSYLDTDRLVVHSANNHFIESTNIEYMYQYLKNRQ